ncbi:MAG: hypothetical protein ABIW76_19575 [Fibrobacteria bacterium]
MIGAILQVSVSCKTEALPADTKAKLPAELKKKLKGKIQANYTFTDKGGLHVLALTRDSTRLPEGSDRIDLQAVQFVSNGNIWNQEWIIKDFLPCQDLDIDADFILPLTSFSDLDSNGNTETTVAYKVACLGGVDPKPTKAILRQGNVKYAARGESLVTIEGTPPFGGAFTLEPNLDNIPAFKAHLTLIWKKAAGVVPQ